MTRYTLPIFTTALLALASGCRDAPPGPPAEANLTLLLPDYIERPDTVHKCVMTLTIDGKDFSEPKTRRKKVVSVSPAPGKDSIKIVLSYYPVIYSKTIRTRRIPMKPGEKLTVDLRKEDKDSPDRFEPIYFPSPESLVREMNEFASVGEADTVMDIGCGDGRLVIAAVKEFKAKKGIGIDINEDLVKLCRENAEKAGIADKAEFKVEDALNLKDLSNCDVVFLYVGEDLGARLAPVLRKTLRPGSRVVSLDFPVGEWKPDERKSVDATNHLGQEHRHQLFLWTVKEMPKE